MVASFVANEHGNAASAGLNGAYVQVRSSADHRPNSNLHLLRVRVVGDRGSSASTNWKLRALASLARLKKSRQNPCNLGLYPAPGSQVYRTRLTRMALGRFARRFTA